MSPETLPNYPQPNNTKERLERAIQSLRENTKSAEPTKYEQLLVRLSDAGIGHIVGAEELAYIYKTADPEKSLRTSISYLNQKLTPFGLHISHKLAYALEDMQYQQDNDYSI